MNAAIRNIQLVAVVIVLLSTIVAFLLEIIKMYEAQIVTLADLLLMFIYIEVIGLVRSYWESRSVRVIYPLVIAITALSRYIILQDKIIHNSMQDRRMISNTDIERYRSKEDNVPI